MPAAAGDTLSKKLSDADQTYHECLDSLPAGVRWGLTSSSSRGRRRWPHKVQKRVEDCLSKRRVMEDIRDVVALKGDFAGLYKGEIDEGQRPSMEEEAEEIASVLVGATTALNGRYKMANVSLWHNFLIWLGAKEGGYCYQWAEELFKALPQQKFAYFERHWGVHNMGRATENNAVIITRRGHPLHRGIVYDPWRGKGSPFWRLVARDSQTWSKLFTENQILSGQM